MHSKDQKINKANTATLFSFSTCLFSLSTQPRGWMVLSTLRVVHSSVVSFWKQLHWNLQRSVDNYHHRSKSNQFNLLNFMNLFLWIFMVFEFISSVFFTSPDSNLHVITWNKKETQVHHILQESKRNQCWTCLFTSKMFFLNSPQKLKFIPI